jgi:hypothetical protein
MIDVRDDGHVAEAHWGVTRAGEKMSPAI